MNAPGFAWPYLILAAFLAGVAIELGILHLPFIQ